MMEMLQLKSKALRLQSLDIAHTTSRGHIGSSFSITDVLVTMYYTDLFDATKDILLMGKGHACLPVYCILNDLGFIDNTLLAEYGTNGGRLGIQFDTTVPTIKYNTGSLGNVFGVGVGLRIANKYRVVCAIVGDGECEEGSIWETADFASRVCPGPMILIVDRNRLGIIQNIDDANLGKKFEAFGLLVKEVDGHNHAEIYNTLKTCFGLNVPSVVIANTVKGKGVSFMENNAIWHAGAMSEKQYLQAKEELQNG